MHQLATVSVFLLGVFACSAGVPGGKRPLDVCSQDTVTKARRAFSLMSDAEGKSFMHLEDAKSQVVSGVNYYFTFVRQTPGENPQHERCAVKYYYQQWTNTETLTSEECEPIDEYTQPHHCSADTGDEDSQQQPDNTNNNNVEEVQEGDEDDNDKK